MRSPVRKFVLCVTVAALLTVCSKTTRHDAPEPAASKSLPTVKVAINTWPGLGPYYVAHAKGFDVQEGVLIDVVMTEDTVARNSSLVAGEVDLIGITLDNIVIARSKGVPMRVVGESDFSNGGDGILARKGIRTVADLRGKTIACPEGLPSQFFLLYVLEKHGLSAKDIKLVPVDDGGQAGMFFASGKVDAAVTWDPWIREAQEKTNGAGHVIISTRDTPGLLLGIVAADKRTLPQRADRILRAQRAWFKAVEYCRAHPSETNEIMAAKYNVPAKEFGAMLSGAQLADRNETMKTFGSSRSPGPILQLAKDASRLWLSAGVIAKPVDPMDVVDWTIVDKLAAGK